METDEKRWNMCKEQRDPRTTPIDNNFSIMYPDSERVACIDPIYELRRTLHNVPILGSIYTIQVIQNVDKYPMLKDSLGYVDFSIRTIFIKYPEYDVKNMANLKEVLHTVIRHEIIHAFLHESGLDNCSNLYEAGWATNEEMVDFFAIQLPKIVQACIDAGIVKINKENKNELL